MQPQPQIFTSLDDIAFRTLDIALMDLFTNNPGQRFSIENIHDYLLRRRFQIDLEKTTSAQRTNFTKRMRNSLARLSKEKYITKTREKTALKGGYRVIFQKHQK